MPVGTAASPVASFREQPLTRPTTAATASSERAIEKTDLGTSPKYSGKKLGIALIAIVTLMAGHPVTAPMVPEFPGKAGLYAGRYISHDFLVDDVPVTVVSPPSPRQTPGGYPWIWRAEFLGAFDGADRALLDAGWYLVYVSVPNRYGDPVAMQAWERAHAALTKTYGFMPRAGLFGFSRGALYAMSWAAAHPEFTLAIYLDNGVCDMRSWPGGRLQNLGQGQGGAKEWTEMLQVWHIAPGDADAVLKASPVSKLEAPAHATIPLLLVYGDSDHVVPAAENSEIVLRKYTVLGGPVQQIVKKGGDHHPHGLDDVVPGGVMPVVTFFETSLARVSAGTGLQSIAPQ